MKKILNLLILVVTCMVYSQKEIVIENPYYKNFKELNLNNISTGILLDYGYSKIDVKKFNGTLQDSTYTSRENFNALYQTLISAVVQKKSNLNQSNLFQKWQNHRKENTITLAGLLYNYNAISQKAVQNGKMQVVNGSTKAPITPGVISRPGGISSDNVIFKENPAPPNAAARSTPLYTNHYAFALAPSVNDFNRSQFSVALPKDIFAVNTTIRKIEINFNDGKGYRQLQYDTPLQVNYTQAKTYTWLYKLVLTNGVTLYSHSKFKINEVTKTIARRTPPGFILDRTRVTITKNGRTYRGFLEVNDAGNNGIRNPVIIAEGFDTGVVTNPEKPEGGNSITGFRRFVRESGNQILENELYFRGRDIIYVNWSNGMDYIENNAEVLKEVIRMVNAAKRANRSTTQNIVIGQSMGGLVARYALKDMEDNRENHDTRLFVSHDAPHQGANAPLSVQYMFRHLRKMVIRNPLLYTASESVVPLFTDGLGGSDYYNLFNNPAVKQMSINWVDRDFNINNNLHKAWQNKLKAKGYPQQTRNVAIANGDVCGNFNNVGENILSVNKTLKPGYLLDLLISKLLGAGSLRFDHVLLGWVPGSPRYKFRLKSSPVLRNGSGKKIYDGLISYKKKILWLVPVTIHLSSKKVNQPSGLLPYDELPGGFFSLAQGALPDGLQDAIVATPSSFIPTISALDYGRGNINHTQSAYQNVIYRNDSNVPFDSYILERGGNRQHISFSNENSAWLVDELRGNTPHSATDEALFCPKDKNMIINKGFECGGASTIFAADFNAPRFEWKITQGNHLVTNLTDTQQRRIAFDVKPNVKGALKVELRYGDTSFRRSTTISSKEFWIGKPEAIGQLGSICTNVFVQPPGSAVINLFESRGADSYFVSSDHPDLKLLGGGTVRPNQPLEFASRKAGRYSATLTTRNKCGSSTGKIYIAVNDCRNGGGGFGGLEFNIYPNPNSNGILTIENNANSRLLRTQSTNNSLSMKNSNSFLKVSEINSRYELYNMQRVLIKKGSLSNTKNELNLSPLQKGIYFLKIFKGDEVKIHQIVMK